MLQQDVIVNEETYTAFFTKSQEQKGDYETPSYPEEITIYYVETPNGVDVLDMFTDQEIEEIQNQII